MSRRRFTGRKVSTAPATAVPNSSFSYGQLFTLQNLFTSAMQAAVQAVSSAIVALATAATPLPSAGVVPAPASPSSKALFSHVPLTVPQKITKEEFVDLASLLQLGHRLLLLPASRLALQLGRVQCIHS